MIKHVDDIKTVAIIGLGLMGGSLAKAIRLKRPGVRIIGVDNSYCMESFYDDCTKRWRHDAVSNVSTVDYAIQNGIVDEGEMELSMADIESADLIVLGSPLYTYADISRRIVDRIKEGAIVTDIGSVKVKPMKELLPIFAGRGIFIGGHPMKGSDRSGIQNASELIYDNTVFFLTATIDEMDQVSGDTETALGVLRDFLEGMGLRPYIVCARTHDMFVAKTSHVPHIGAALLVKGISDVGLKSVDFIADGFKDTTRIAASNPKLWTDIFFTNRETIISELRNMRDDIDFFIEALENGDEMAVKNYMDMTSQLRKSLNTVIARDTK